MRLFLAVDLDEVCRAAVAELAQTLRARLDPALVRGATWVAPANLHISLRFLGQVRDEAVAPLCHAFEEPLRLAPFEIELGGLGAFPGTGAPRVLWVGVRTGETSLGALYDEVHTRLAKLKVPAEARPFHPHITLGRFKRDRLPQGSRLPAWIHQAEDRIGPMMVGELSLFESRLSPRGPTYVPKLRTPLVGR